MQLWGMDEVFLVHQMTGQPAICCRVLSATRKEGLGEPAAARDAQGLPGEGPRWATGQWQEKPGSLQSRAPLPVAPSLQHGGSED